VTKYVEKIFSVRVKKKDGTLKLLQGVHGIPMVGAIIKSPRREWSAPHRQDPVTDLKLTLVLVRFCGVAA
jgi:hypothetical protein